MLTLLTFNVRGDSVTVHMADGQYVVHKNGQRSTRHLTIRSAVDALVECGVEKGGHLTTLLMGLQEYQRA